MPITLESVVEQLSESGIIAPGKLERFVPPKAHPQSVEELLRELSRQNLLTKFQRAQVAAGRAKSLILGGYTILDKIGAGGMGQVFKAEHRRMKRTVAIKTLPPKTMRDEAAVVRFQREVEAAAKLRHPNIVAADDADEFNGIHFLVMEYVEGSDLSALVKKNGPLPVAKAIDCILQAAHGLEFAHKRGVVHRDVKPSNLLLDREGTVKILDMGLARIEMTGADASTLAELTGQGNLMGTLDYISPEQALDSRRVDPRADIYSLGCTLCYLLTGRPVYDGETTLVKLLAHREMPIPTLGPEVPEPVQAVFRTMIAKKAEDRYQTMTEVISALESCVNAQRSTLSTGHAPAQSRASDVTALLKTETEETPQEPVPNGSASPAKGDERNRGTVLRTAGAAVLGLAILAAVILRFKTADGTLVVEVDQAHATVEILDEAGTVEISRKGEKGPITISVDPGKHRLKVEKDGFRFFTQDFVVESGGKKSIKALLIPLESQTVVARPKSLLAFQKPGFDQWVEAVSGLPGEKQLEQVIKKLQELNPGFDGKATHELNNGVVTGLEFASDHVTDISPVRSLTDLRWLRCDGIETARGSLSDLSPLKGMPLTLLHCDQTRVSDLSALRGMPLTHLSCEGTQVEDLTPLEGMPLTVLACNKSNVSDLSPLLHMRLSWFSCWRTRVSDLSPLKGMPLEELIIHQTRVSEIAAVEGMPLKRLHFWGQPVADLSPLKGMSLTFLSCGGSQVSDLSPLRGMPLTFLSCGMSRVSDLSPLRGMPLTFLSCGGSQVSDLSPLRGMPLEELRCENSRVCDLSPLEGMQLAEIFFTPANVSNGIDIIRRMTSLKKICAVSREEERISPDEFWKKYDAGEFGNPKPGAAFHGIK